jgi:hypothetical protein
MTLNRYNYSTNNSYLDFEFDSIGPKGSIKKVVRFTEVEDGIYNLGFGDLDGKTGEIKDSIATNNADTEKVLPTIALIAFDFTSRHPGVIIYIEGSSKSRTRLYQINIAKYLPDINALFEIHGLFAGEWLPFCTGTNYAAFIAWRRS